MWVVTAEYNEYDQVGQVFIAAWNEKPTVEYFMSTGMSEEDAVHLWNGGGRKDVEYEWFFLTEYKEGSRFGD